MENYLLKLNVNFIHFILYSKKLTVMKDTEVIRPLQDYFGVLQETNVKCI